MITLCQFAPVPGWEVNASPFCLKVETYLRCAGLPFRAEATLPMKAPKGKLPFIIDEDGRRIPDSGQIVAHLEATRGALLDGGLSQEQRARGHLIRRTCEESLYFVLLYSRWFDEDGWRLVKPAYFHDLPAPLRLILPDLIRRRLRRDALGQGLLRHSRDEIYALGCADLDALAAALGDRAFFVADRPSSADVCAYAFLANILKAPLRNPLRDRAKSHERLASFVSHIDQHLKQMQE